MHIVLRARTVSPLVVVLFALGTGGASAQLWQWDVVTHLSDQTPVTSQSRVELSPQVLLMTYSANAGDKQVLITSCRARLGDIAAVQTVTNNGQSFLYVAMKAKHAAFCGAAKQPIALVPIGSDDAAREALASIKGACCRVAAAPPARPPARPAPPPRPRLAAARHAPPARPSAAPVSVAWLENQGLFAFVRIRNRGLRPLTITDGAIDHCRSVAYGCGRFRHRPLTVAPGAVRTVATVMSEGARDGSAFAFWYQARSGTARTSGSGASGRSRVRATMSPQEIRLAEAAAVFARGARSDPPLPARVAPRLVHRGFTRLGGGHRGVARVRVRIGSDGMPLNASIVSISNRALIAAALELAVSSTYAPAVRRGRPQDAYYVATFRF